MFDLNNLIPEHPHAALAKLVQDASAFMNERVVSLPPHLLLAIAGGLLFLLTCLIGVVLLVSFLDL